MTNNRAIIGWRGAILAAGLIIGIGAAPASASSAPIVVTYQKTCVLTATPTCEGTTEDGDVMTMQITGFRDTGKAPHLTFNESVVGELTLTAVMSGHNSPAGFIVLNGTVTSGPFGPVGACTRGVGNGDAGEVNPRKVRGDNRDKRQHRQDDRELHCRGSTH